MKKAFTLVELLVVVSIISIVTIFSMSSFMRFIDEKEIESGIIIFKDDIKSLDKKIKNKEILDYKIEFSTWTKYKIIENNFDLDKYLTIDSIYWTWEIKLQNAETSDKFYIKIYEDGQKKVFSWWLTEYNLKINDNFDYKITWYLSWTKIKELNTITIKNLEKDEKTLILYKLTDTKIPEIAFSDKIFLENISWKKSFLYKDWTKIDTNKINLYFEKNGKEAQTNIEF